MLQWTVDNKDETLTLLGYLRQTIGGAPESYINHLIRRGKILVNGNRARSEDILRHGDVVSLPSSARLNSLVQSASLLPEILFESRDILVAYKPAGLATHAGKGHEHDNLTIRVRQLVATRGERFVAAPVHRLDLQTSGPVLFGKGKRSISRLGTLMQENGIEKTYLALVAAGLPPAGLLSGTLPSKGRLKQSSTEFRVIMENDAFSLLELKLVTGRQHQIRRQLAQTGHPIVGDRRYRGIDMIAGDTIFLHCCRLEFIDPFSPRTIRIDARMPAVLEEFLGTCGLSLPDIPFHSGDNRKPP